MSVWTDSRQTPRSDYFAQHYINPRSILIQVSTQEGGSVATVNIMYTVYCISKTDINTHTQYIVFIICSMIMFILEHEFSLWLVFLLL